MPSPAKQVCMYSTEAGEEAMRLTAEMLGMRVGRTPNRRSGDPIKMIGNKSWLLKVMVAAALEAAMEQCDDPELLARAKKLLPEVKVVMESSDGSCKVLTSRIVRIDGPRAPRFVGLDGEPLPRHRYEPDPENPGYERRVM